MTSQHPAAERAAAEADGKAAPPASPAGTPPAPQARPAGAPAAPAARPARPAPARGAQAEAAEAGVDRRYFLRWLMWGSAFVFFVQSALAGLAMFWPRRVTGFGSRIDAGPVASFPVGSVTRFREGKFYLSRLEGGIIALYWRCTHLGCTVPWREDEGLFHCPCHGSLYERTGQNIAGPAPRPLDYMTVEVVGGRIFVNTREIHQRAVHSPEHVTPV